VSADGETFRAVAGSGVCLGVLALLALRVGATLRHTAGSITAVLALVLGPVIATGLMPENLAELLEKFSLMGAGIAIQQTVERPDNIPIAPGPAFLVLGAYAVAALALALALALWLIGRRDA
jgi:ABC-2 type transport system permease protein